MSTRPIKILLIGDSGVGKTAILYRFADDVFNPTFISTIGIDFKVKPMTIDGKEVKLQIWDTAGQERFKQTLTPAYYRNADGVLLVFDVTELDSLQNISTWMRNIEENATTDVEKLLIANKCDLYKQRQITADHVSRYAFDHNIDYFETSAKTGVNVHEVFQKMAAKVLAKRPVPVVVVPEVIIPTKPTQPAADVVIKLGRKRSKLKNWKKRCNF